LFWFVFPTNKSPVQNLNPNIGITYTTPRYLAVGDQNMIEVTLLNKDTTNVISGTVTLIFSDSTISLTSIPDQRLSFQIEDLLPGDRVTEQMKLKLIRGPSSDIVEFYFQFFLSDGSLYKSKNDVISISPVPNIRTTWSWATGAGGILGLFLGFLFDRLKNLFN
jgi:hypothetical protein